MRLQTKHEFSSGGVVYRQEGKTTEFLMGKHSSYHKWVLPKGLVEKGENPQDTTVREVKEEMGVTAKITDIEPIRSVEYFYIADFKEKNDNSRRVISYQENGGKKTRVHKKVVYYLMKYISGDPKNHGWEMEDANWFSYHDALKKLAFEGEKQVLILAAKKLAILK